MKFLPKDVLKLLAVVFGGMTFIYFLPLILVVCAPLIAKILPERFMWSNEFSANLFEKTLPRDKTTVCNIAKKLEKYNDYSTYLYSFNRNSAELELKEHYLQLGSQPSFGETFILYGQDKVYISYHGKYTTNVTGTGFDAMENKNIEDRITYGFKQIDAKAFCDIVDKENIIYVDDNKTYSDLMIKLYRNK